MTAPSRTRFAIAIAAIALCGCLSPQEQAASDAAYFDTQCRSYGAEPGSDNYFQCRFVLQQQLDARRSANAYDVGYGLGQIISAGAR